MREIESCDLLTNDDYSKVYWSPLFPVRDDVDHVYAIPINDIMQDEWKFKIELVSITELSLRNAKGYLEIDDFILPQLINNSSFFRGNFKSLAKSMITMKIYTNPEYGTYINLSEKLDEYL